MLTIEASALSGALKNAASVVQSATTLPILANVRIMAGGGKMELVTCDMDTEYRQTLQCNGEIEFTAHAGKLAQIAGACDGLVSFEHSEGRLTIRCGRSRWTLPTLPVADFPILPVDSLCAPMAVTGIGDQIRRVSWSIYNDKVASPLAGVFLHNDKGPKLAAASKSTLALAPLDAKFPKDAPDVIMPTKFCMMLANLSEGEVSLSWDQRKVRAEFGDVVLTSKLMEGGFVDYKRIIPAPNEAPIVAEPDSLLAALRRVRLIEAEKTRGVKFERGEGKVTISSEALGTGQSCEEVPADCVEGFATGLNGQFMAGFLEAIGGDSIELHQADATSALMVRRVVDDGCLAIVMPMRV